MSCVFFSQYFNRFDLVQDKDFSDSETGARMKYHSLMGIHSSQQGGPGNGMIISFQLNSLGGGTLIVCDGSQ